MNIFLTQWKSELWKLFARKRTYLGFGAFILLELVLFILFQMDKVGKSFFRNMIGRQGESFEDYFSALTLGYFVLRFSVLILGAIYLTLVAGDMVAKESEDGNLRLLLVRPISRIRLLVVKFASCLAYTFALMQFISWSSLGVGILMRGWGGGLFAFAPEQQFIAFYDAGEGLVRYALASVTLALSMCVPVCLAFFFSCWRIKPAAATITALSYLFIDMILRETRVMASYDHFLLTYYMSSWSMVFHEVIPWASMMRNYAILGGVGLTLFVMGAAVFESRDFKS